ncbi:MAG: phosphatidate cytidylyltransferase [Promethearchaeota archaeon]
MVIFRLLDSLILWIYGIAIIFLTIRYWNYPQKTIKIKVSEIIYGIAYIINGIIMFFIFDLNGLESAMQNYLYGLLFIVFVSVLFWLWIINVFYTYMRIKKHPELLREDAEILRIRDLYWEKVEREYERTEAKDIIKDISRKLLHIVVLAVIIFAHEITKMMETDLVNKGLTPLAMRNFIYYTLAFLFLLMFSTADLLRIYKFELLPDWGLKWYSKSLELKTEKYTFISSVPFLLSLLLLVPLSDFAIILVAGVVSCIADSAASIVGKNFGNHKMTKFGRYPNKSFEGFAAGAFSAFLGTFLAFNFYPVNGVTTGWQIFFGILAALTFIYADAFSKYIVDNILNTLLPAGLILIFIIFFV